MKRDNKSSTKTGLGFAEALALLFIALKLCKVIDWPWIWILSPIWMVGAIALLGLGIYGCILLIDKWKVRGTVPCTNCEYRGAKVSYGLRKRTIYCTKTKEDHPIDYRCKDGVKEKKLNHKRS